MPTRKKPSRSMPKGMNEYESEVLNVARAYGAVAPIGRYAGRTDVVKSLAISISPRRSADPEIYGNEFHGLVDISYASLRRAIGGGLVERYKLPSGNVLIFDEEGVLKGLPVNPLASMIIGGRLVGTVVFIPKEHARMALR